MMSKVVTISEVEAPGLDGVKTKTVIIGPDYAELLLKRNNRNRPLSHPRIARYARAMAAGRWRFVGDAIQVDMNGDLLNGQKRLHAIVLSGAEITVNLVTGLPPEAQRVMDQGQARSASNQLSIEGASNASAAAAVARLMLAWDAGRLTRASKGDVTSNDEVVEWVIENNEAIQAAIILADRVRKHVPFTTASVGAVAYRARQFDHEAADEFFDTLAHGANLELGSPILTLRNHVMKLRTQRTHRTNVELIYLLVITWNAWRTGRQDMHRIQLPKGGLTDARIPVML